MYVRKVQLLRHRDGTQLAVRGRFARIFLGLGLFAALPLFASGVYLLT